jgi:hypothetical protein
MKYFWNDGGKNWIITILVGLLTFAIAWGSIKNQVEIDRHRIDTLEQTTQEINQRLSNIEGKIDLLIKEKYK